MELISPLDGPYVLFERKEMLDFSSYDFLGLSQHPEVKKEAIKYTLKYGVGNLHPFIQPMCQHEVETKLAHYLGREAVVLFPSFSELLFKLHQMEATLISTETGEMPSFKKNKGFKVVDDTFLLGVTGPSGFGCSNQLSHADAICGSLSCGIGASGGFIAGSKKSLASLTPSSFLSFPVIGALDCAISFVPEMANERKIIQKNKEQLVKALACFSIKELRSPRIILTFKSKEKAHAVRQCFLQEGLYLAPPQEETLYVSTTALHTPEELKQLADSIKKLEAADFAPATQSLTPTPPR
jgi:7-keto-8-aminopelargonate synthetase-like enzyme